MVRLFLVFITAVCVLFISSKPAVPLTTNPKQLGNIGNQSSSQASFPSISDRETSDTRCRRRLKTAIAHVLNLPRWTDAPLGMKQVNTGPSSLILIAFSLKNSMHIQKCTKTELVTCSAFQTKRRKILSDNRRELSYVS